MTTTTKRTSAKAAEAASPTHQPSEEQRALLKAAGGSEDSALNLITLARTLGTAWALDGTRDDHTAMISLAAATRTAMAAFEPSDPVQGLLVGQIVGLHHGAMENLRRAVLPDQSAEGASRSWKDAASLARAMTETMSALDRWRRRDAPAV